MSRTTFEQWLDELRVLVEQNLEVKLEDLPEFDRSDARAYFKGRDAPVVYFQECLSEGVGSNVTLKEIVSHVNDPG